MTDLPRVPITVNGKPAVAMFTASTIPDCWMSETYFKKIGLGRDDIEQVPGITDAISYISEDTTPILGIADRPLNLKIGDCPVIFKIQPFIIEVPNDRFWNQFHFTDLFMIRLGINRHPPPINGITIGKANDFRVPFVPKTPKNPEDPYVLATLHLGPNSQNGGLSELMEKRS